MNNKGHDTMPPRKPLLASHKAAIESEAEFDALLDKTMAALDFIQLAAEKLASDTRAAKIKVAALRAYRTRLNEKGDADGNRS